MTLDAPAASAMATSRGCRTPPSAHTCLPYFFASAAHSRTAENCGRPTPVIMRVVHMAPGPTPTLTMSAPASIEIAYALGCDDVARDDRDLRVERADRPDRGDHRLLVAVRRVDDERVDARVQQLPGLARDVAVDTDGGGDPQLAVRVGRPACTEWRAGRPSW